MFDTRPRIWVCTACGRTAQTQQGFAHVSCTINAELVYSDTILRGEGGQVVWAEAVGIIGVEV